MINNNQKGQKVANSFSHVLKKCNYSTYLNEYFGKS